MEKIKQIKKKNTSIPEKEILVEVVVRSGSEEVRNDTTRLVNTVWRTCNNCQLYENTYTDSCALSCLIVRVEVTFGVNLDNFTIYFILLGTTFINV